MEEIGAKATTGNVEIRRKTPAGYGRIRPSGFEEGNRFEAMEKSRDLETLLAKPIVPELLRKLALSEATERCRTFEKSATRHHGKRALRGARSNTAREIPRYRMSKAQKRLDIYA